jgi:hypothetical protein
LKIAVRNEDDTQLVSLSDDLYVHDLPKSASEIAGGTVLITILLFIGLFRD